MIFVLNKLIYKCMERPSAVPTKVIEVPARQPSVSYSLQKSVKKRVLYLVLDSKYRHVGHQQPIDWIEMVISLDVQI